MTFKMKFHLIWILSLWMVGCIPLEEKLDQLNKEMKKVMIKKINNDKQWENDYCNIKHDAYYELIEYRDKILRNEIEDETQCKIIQLYLLTDWYYLNPDMFKQLHNIQEQGRKALKPFFNSFYKSAAEMPINLAKEDIDKQTTWSNWCTKLESRVKDLINEYFAVIKNAANENNSEHNQTLWFWKNAKGYYSGFKWESLEKIWDNDLKFPYLELMLHMRYNLKDLFSIYKDIQYKDEPMPAYIHDLIFNSYTLDGTKTYDLEFRSPATKYRLRSIHVDPYIIQNHTVEMITIQAQEYFESLGFDKLNDYFWKTSVFIDMKTVSSGHTVNHYYTEGKGFWLEVIGIADVPTTLSIYRNLFAIHRLNLVMKDDKPAIFWDTGYNIFNEAIKETFVKMWKSPFFLRELGFLKQEYMTFEKTIEKLKISALGVLVTISSAMAKQTWEWDAIAKKFSTEDRICEYWNYRYRFENVVPVTIDSIQFNARDQTDFFMKHFLVFDGFGMDYHSELALLLRYQIMGYLCTLAGQYNPKNPLEKPLYKCNVKGNLKVGTLIKSILSAGSTKNWFQLLDMISGTTNTTVSAKSLLDYYAPVFDDIRNTKGYQKPSTLPRSKRNQINFCQ